MTATSESVRVLPFAPVLHAGQSVESFLESLAFMHRVPVSAILRRLRLDPPARAQGLLDLDDASLAMIATTCRVDEEGLVAGTLRYYREQGAAPAERDAVHTRTRKDATFQARASGSRFCPHCLAEVPERFFVSWHLWWSFACLRHGCVLVDRCPDCGHSPRSGEGRRTSTLEPWRCRRRLSRRQGAKSEVCGADLRSASAIAVGQRSPIVLAQRWVGALIGTPERPASGSMTLMGIDVPRAEVLSATEFLIRRLAMLCIDPSTAVVHHLVSTPQRICRIAPQEVVTKPYQERLNAVATDALAFGALAAMAVDCLSAPTVLHASTTLERFCDLGTADSRAQPALIDGNGTTWREFGQHRIQSRRRSGLIDAITLTSRSGEMTPTEQMAFRIASPIPRRPIPPSASSVPWPHSRSRAPVLSSDYVPQTMWSTVMAQLPRATAKDTGAWETVASMILLRLGTFTRWAPVALDLDLPASFARTPHAVLSRLVESELLEESLFVLDGLHQWLEDYRPPIDYRRRRSAFADLIDPGPGWQEACADHGIVATERRRRLLGHALYERITGSDARMRRCHPIPAGEQRVAYHEFCTVAVPALAGFLDTQARELLDRHDIDEPIRWEPTYDYDGGWSGSPSETDPPSTVDNPPPTQGKPSDVDVVIHTLATSGQYDGVLVDLVSHANGTGTLVGPQADGLRGLYTRSQNGPWELDDAGLQVFSRFERTFGPALDLNQWDRNRDEFCSSERNRIENAQ